MQDKPMVRVHQVLGWNALHQAGFDFIHVVSRCQPGAVAHPKNVCVNGHDRFTKSRIEHHISRFATYAGQRLQSFAGTRYLAAVLFNQNLTGLQQMFGFAAVQANGLDVALQPVQPEVEDFLRGVGHGEKLACGLVNAHVGSLR